MTSKAVRRGHGARSTLISRIGFWWLLILVIVSAQKVPTAVQAFRQLEGVCCQAFLIREFCTGLASVASVRPGFHEVSRLRIRFEKTGLDGLDAWASLQYKHTNGKASKPKNLKPKDRTAKLNKTQP